MNFNPLRTIFNIDAPESLHDAVNQIIEDERILSSAIAYPSLYLASVKSENNFAGIVSCTCEMLEYVKFAKKGKKTVVRHGKVQEEQQA